MPDWGNCTRSLSRRWRVSTVQRSLWIDSTRRQRPAQECGYAKKRMPLKYRTYICMACGLTIDRDLNAAINLEDEARRILRDLAA